MTTVVDASVALKWVCAEDGSDRAAALLDGQPLIAPALWMVEAANALWRRVQRAELSALEADERLTVLTGAPVRTVADSGLTVSALKLATELGHPVYDCLYLATALRYGARVVTADRRFFAIASAQANLSSLVSLL